MKPWEAILILVCLVASFTAGYHVRGDVARTTEGSGLGLSIAKSLTLLQGGLFEIYIDGDLFKAQVGFPVLSRPRQADTPQTSDM